MPEITSLYICYWSLKDPLCQTQCLSYLRGLAAKGHRFALMTFEQRGFLLTREQKRDTRKELAREGIYWYPRRYHKRVPLISTAFDLVCGMLTGVYVVLRYRARVVHSRASVAGAMAVVISKLCRIKFLYDADSRLSEEYADNGHWRRGSLAFRLLAWFEDACRRNANAVVVLATRLRDDFQSLFHVTSPIEVIPCCVDTATFGAETGSGAARRSELGLSQHEVLFVYVGKSGRRYLTREMFAFFKIARVVLGGARLVVLSGDAPAAFEEAAAEAGLNRDDYQVKKAARGEVVEWLAAADAGIALIRPAGCERGSSPIKIGEYLAAGLPVIVTNDIGDYSELISSHRAGVLVSGLDAGCLTKAAEQLGGLLNEGDAVRARCRTLAQSAASLEAVGIPRYESVYGRLLSSDASTVAGEVLRVPTID